MQKRMSHGGKRTGAGRPALPDEARKVPVCARVSPELVQWLDNQAGSRSSVIEEALCYFKRMR